MSGGYFDYNQYKINDIIDGIERILNRQGNEIPKDELFGSEEYYKKYPQDKFYITYPNVIQEKMKESIRYLKIAQIYAQRIDWFLSGDDGEETFIERLNDDLKAIK